jgi:hypothetical protein
LKKDLLKTRSYKKRTPIKEIVKEKKEKKEFQRAKNDPRQKS